MSILKAVSKAVSAREASCNLIPSIPSCVGEGGKEQGRVCGRLSQRRSTTKNKHEESMPSVPLPPSPPSPPSLPPSLPSSPANIDPPSQSVHVSSAGSSSPSPQCLLVCEHMGEVCTNNVSTALIAPLSTLSALAPLPSPPSLPPSLLSLPTLSDTRVFDPFPAHAERRRGMLHMVMLRA